MDIIQTYQSAKWYHSWHILLSLLAITLLCAIVCFFHTKNIPSIFVAIIVTIIFVPLFLYWGVFHAYCLISGQPYLFVSKSGIHFHSLTKPVLILKRQVDCLDWSSIHALSLVEKHTEAMTVHFLKINFTQGDSAMVMLNPYRGNRRVLLKALQGYHRIYKNQP